VSALPGLSVVRQLVNPIRDPLPRRDAGHFSSKGKGADPLSNMDWCSVAILLRNFMRASPHFPICHRCRHIQRAVMMTIVSQNSERTPRNHSGTDAGSSS
jgi:hypothetical protein